LPVTRSSKRAPMAMSRSAFWNAVTAGTLPCIPGMPRCSWCESGKAPRAMSVVTTGMFVSLGQAQQLLLRFRADDAAADVEHRTLGFGDQPCGLADLLGVRFEDRTVAGQHGLIGPHERCHARLRVLRDVDEDGAGRPVVAM
jgi:hypothetical protein